MKHHNCSTILSDYEPIQWKGVDFPQNDWQEFYHAEEAIPLNAPEPHGMLGQVNAFVDACHPNNCITHHSHKAILVLWMSPCHIVF